MDIVRIRCGFGNQMFQYAFYLALKGRGRDVRLDLSFYDKYPEFVNPYELTNVFTNIHFTPIDNGEFDRKWQFYLDNIKNNPEKMEYYEHHPEERHYWGEPVYGTFDENVFKTKDCIFVGVWYCPKYFEGYEDVVRQSFVFPTGERKLQNLAKFLYDQESVSIQFRLANNYYEERTPSGFLPFNIIKDGYYGKAIHYLEKNVNKKKIYVVFSDDHGRVSLDDKLTNVIHINKEMFDDYKDWYDMYLMSCCKHNIIANSSFGWWGAWLKKRKDGQVIAPRFFDDRCKDLTEAYPDDWIKM